MRRGDPVTLKCNYSGIPTPSLYWRVDGPSANKDVRQGNPVNLINDNDPMVSEFQTLTVKNGNLQISNVDDLDKERVYKCVVENRLGKASSNVTLTLVGGMGFTSSTVLYIYIYIYIYIKGLTP